MIWNVIEGISMSFQQKGWHNDVTAASLVENTRAQSQPQFCSDFHENLNTAFYDKN